MQRTRAIIAAAIAAVLTGVALFAYVSGADRRAAEKESPVTILAAAQPVSASSPFDQAYNSGAIVAVQVPKRLVPPTAVSDPQVLVGQLATATLSVGQLVVRESFAKPEDLKAFGASAVSRRIPEGRVAVTFSAGGQAAVAGLIQPGDSVNLMIQVDDLSEIGLPGGRGGDDSEAAVVHVFQNLEVFALGTTASADPTKAGAAPAAPAGAEGAPPALVAGSLYTVLVDPKDAARLILLTTRYPVTLALVNPDYTPRDIPPVLLDKDGLPKGLTPDESAGKG